tara:strand:- start:69 stop:491 length:423 start_codon:yes stop_codon:yes gene_type:complete
MIKYNLKCNNNHEFESWFSDSDEFNKLNKKKLLECIYCSSNKIQKSIMAPMLAGTKVKVNSIDIFDKQLLRQKNSLIKLRKHIEKNFEFVGDKFSEKIREVYYDKKTKKSIYGTTTLEQRKDLADEGIDLISIPWVSKDN